MKLPCRKTEKTMSAGYSDFCGTGAGGMNSMVWDVYELTDRKSHYYYILKNNVDQVAIARYASVYIGDDEPKERMGMDELMESVFGIVSEKDIRSVTLTRCRPVSEENPEVLMAMYTTPAEKQQILEVLSRNRVIYNVWEGVDEEQNALPEWYSVEKLKDGGWYDATSAMPENCYLMTIENRYREEMILGVVALEEEVRVFVDIDVKGIIQRKRVSDDLIICYEENHCIGLLPEQQKQVSEWIRLAE